MITLTKEWLLKTIAELEEERDATPGVVNEDAAMALAAMKLALASLEAEPVISHVGSKNALDDIVAFIKSNRNPTLKDHNQVSERLFQDNCHGLSNHVIEYIKQIGEELEELRSTQDAAPPAPVSVPDEIRLLQSEVTIWKDRWELLRELFREVADALGCDVKDNQAMLDKIEMLQGTEPVTTAYKLPEGWVACSERMPDPDSAFRVCAYTPTPHEDVRFRFVPASLFKSVCRDATHWQYMLPPAAPQQEVKQ